MKNPFAACIAGMVLAVSCPLVAWAHHSAVAEFDVNRPILLTGTVKSMQFTNPHTWLYVEITTKSGQVQEWAIEGSAPNIMLRRGWDKNTLRPGTPIKVRGFQARDGSRRATGINVTFADGSTLDMGNGRGGASD